VAVGLVAAAFFVVIFPGNVGQWLEHKDGFGLDTDAKRFGRLFFQPVLVAWALWSTGALRALRDARSRDRSPARGSRTAATGALCPVARREGRVMSTSTPRTRVPAPARRPGRRNQDRPPPPRAPPP